MFDQYQIEKEPGAEGNNCNKIVELINLIHSFSSVRRYSTKTLIKDENIAEHSAHVGVICLFIYDLLDESDKSIIDINKLLAFSIFHDLDEIFTGDILNPVKYFHKDIKDNIDKYSDMCIEECRNRTGLTSILNYTDKSNLNLHEQSILKMADVLSVFVKFRIENSLGNQMLNIDYVNIERFLIHTSNYKQLFSNSNKLISMIEVIARVCSDLTDQIRTNHSNILNLGYN